MTDTDFPRYFANASATAFLLKKPPKVFEGGHLYSSSGVVQM
ncbi:MAG TPA: hypothetical protein VKR57_09760 [Terriglobales bacterium]|nr:hypothetical protein [Terriglobales bacterium]